MNERDQLRQRQLNVRVPEWVVECLQQRAAREGESLSAIVRAVLRHGVHAGESCTHPRLETR
jgi:predicted HicB family RNase H-like nuclease